MLTFKHLLAQVRQVRATLHKSAPKTAATSVATNVPADLKPYPAYPVNVERTTPVFSRDPKPAIIVINGNLSAAHHLSASLIDVATDAHLDDSVFFAGCFRSPPNPHAPCVGLLTFVTKLAKGGQAICVTDGAAGPLEAFSTLRAGLMKVCELSIPSEPAADLIDLIAEAVLHRGLLVVTAQELDPGLQQHSVSQRYLADEVAAQMRTSMFRGAVSADDSTV